MSLDGDTDLIRDLRARLEAAERDNDELRGALDLASEGVDAHEERSSRFWFASWREASRKRAALEAEVARLKSR